jgi:Uma2 family endonuclease
MSASAPRRTATLADWLAAPDDLGLELIDGALVPKASPGIDHGTGQGRIFAAVLPFDRKPAGSDVPGGWRIGVEIDVWLDGRGLRPDVAGWRRERMPIMSKDRPVILRPDWVCEVLNDSNRKHDTVAKLAWYGQAGVPHYWILDPTDRTLTVHRHTAEGYLIVLRAAAGERVRAEPFAAIELEVAVLLGDDPADDPADAAVVGPVDGTTKPPAR